MKLSSIDFNGNGLKLIREFDLRNKPITCSFFDIYDDDIYTYNLVTHELMKISNNNNITENIMIQNNTKIKMMKIIDPSLQPNGPNKCNESFCTHICLPDPYSNNYFSCICPEEKYLLPGEICQTVCCKIVIGAMQNLIFTQTLALSYPSLC